MERFENYFETDAKGNPLLYLERVIGRPKKANLIKPQQSVDLTPFLLLL